MAGGEVRGKERTGGLRDPKRRIEYFCREKIMTLHYSVIRVGMPDSGAPLDLLVVRSPYGVRMVEVLDAQGEADPETVIRNSRKIAYGCELVREDAFPGLDAERIRLDPVGTEFQRKVWDAIREIPLGETRSYREVAHRAGFPRSVRAVANAVGANRIAFLIPCHRVVRSDGSPGGYRWGESLKRRLLRLESGNAVGEIFEVIAAGNDNRPSGYRLNCESVVEHHNVFIPRNG